MRCTDRDRLISRLPGTRWPKPFSVAEEIGGERSCIFALVDIAEEQPKLGDPSQAEQTIVKALAVARRIMDGKDRASALCRIAEAQSKTGDSDGALRSIAKATEIANRIADECELASTLCDIAVAQATAGDNRAALATARRIASDGRRGALLVNICDAQCWVNEKEEAAATAMEIESARDRCEAHVSIARLRWRNGNAPEAAQLLGLAVETAATIADSSALHVPWFSRRSQAHSSMPSSAESRNC